MADEKCTCNKEVSSIPYVAYESTMEREDRKQKRLWIVILVLIVALVGTNAGWIYYENQFQDEVTTITQSGEADGSGTVLLNNSGEINYGESDTDDNR